MSGAELTDEELMSVILRRGVGYDAPDPALGGLDEDLAVLRLFAKVDSDGQGDLAHAGAVQLARAIEVLAGKALPAPAVAG